jgi:hypothetical protein
VVVKIEIREKSHGDQIFIPRSFKHVLFKHLRRFRDCNHSCKDKLSNDFDLLPGLESHNFRKDPCFSESNAKRLTVFLFSVLLKWHMN